MTLAVTHAKVDAIPDNAADAAAGKVLPSDWNAAHTLTGGTAGAVLFDTGTTISEDASNLFWDDTNNRLGIGTNAPTVRLQVRDDVAPTVNTSLFSLRSDSPGQGPFMEFLDGATPSQLWFGGESTYFWFLSVSSGGIPLMVSTLGPGNGSLIATSSDGIFAWNNSTVAAEILDGSVDTVLTRVSAGVVAVGNTQVVGDFAGTLKLTTVNLAGNVAVTSQAPSSGAWTLTLPADDGTNGYVLQTNGSGTTSWVTPGAASLAVGGAITGGTAGSVLFESASNQLGEDSANFFWDNSNNFLGLGTNAPSVPLHVSSHVNNTLIIASDHGDGVSFVIDATASGGNAYEFFASSNTNPTGIAFGVFDETNFITPWIVASYSIGGGNFATLNEINANGIFAWSSDSAFATVGTVDTGVSRLSPGIVAVGNGTLGDFSGSVEATNFMVVAVAIGSLPGSAPIGTIACVSDALVPVIGSPVAAGGSAKALVWNNGSAFTVFAV